MVRQHIYYGPQTPAESGEDSRKNHQELTALSAEHLPPQAGFTGELAPLLNYFQLYCLHLHCIHLHCSVLHNTHPTHLITLVFTLLLNMFHILIVFDVNIVFECQFWSPGIPERTAQEFQFTGERVCSCVYLTVKIVES